MSRRISRNRTRRVPIGSGRGLLRCSAWSARGVDRAINKSCQEHLRRKPPLGSRYMRPCSPFISVIAAVTIAATPLFAQTSPGKKVDPPGVLRVYIDCQTKRGCDHDYFRSEMSFVDFM